MMQHMPAAAGFRHLENTSLLPTTTGLLVVLSFFCATYHIASTKPHVISLPNQVGPSTEHN